MPAAVADAATRTDVDMEGGASTAAAAPAADERRAYSVVVHVHGDHAFKKYLQNCTPSDLLLYRGLLLEVRGGGPVGRRRAGQEGGGGAGQQLCEHSGVGGGGQGWGSGGLTMSH